MREWWRGGVIYQIYPRSFQDSNDDGIGDLAGIIARLDHVASLGVDAVWLSPIFPSPMDDMGYDVSNYTDIDPIFGSLEDFDTLVTRAHELGLKVMIDQVLSHTSDRHPWFQESRLNRTNSRADWYVWADARPDGTPPNNWLSVFGGSAWEWNPARGQYYLHNFLKTQPDLNFYNEAVQDAVLEVMRFWLERGVDGFRFDTANFYFHDERLRDNPPARRPEHLPYAVNPYDMQEHRYSKSRPENIAFLRRIRKLMNEFPGTATMGEIGDSHKPLELMAEYTSGGDKLNMCYSFELLQEAFSVAHVRSCLEAFFGATSDGWPCWSFSNHDVERHVSRWEKHGTSRTALGKQCAALLLSLKGSVCIYQGEELGLPQAELLFEELTDPPGIRFWPEYKGRDGCRTPIPWEEGDPPNGFTRGSPWLPVKPEHSALNVASQNADPGSVLEFYRRMLKFRASHRALVDGEIAFLDTPEPLLAYRRTGGDGEALLCLFNLSPEPLSLELGGGALQTAPISRGASLRGSTLELAGSGFAFIEGEGVRIKGDA